MEKQSLLRSQYLHHLVESVFELWEAVKEHVTFNHQDIVQGLGATCLEFPSHESHTIIFSCVLLSPNEEQQFRRATIYAASPITERDMAECAASPTRTDRENPCLLVITASVAQLKLGPCGNSARRPATEGNVFQNPWMVATFAVPTRAVCYRDATIKELKE